MIDLLVGFVGGAIVFAAAWDVFRSLLVPRAGGRSQRAAPALNAGLPAGWHATANRMTRPRLRQTVRASFASLMLVLIMAVWAGSLISGFGLIVWMDRANPRCVSTIAETRCMLPGRQSPLSASPAAPLIT